MQNPLWKLTALAGVIGVGAMVVTQAQRSLLNSSGDGVSEFFSSLDDAASETEVANSDAATSAVPPGEQSEPQEQSAPNADLGAALSQVFPEQSEPTPEPAGDSAEASAEPAFLFSAAGGNADDQSATDTDSPFWTPADAAQSEIIPAAARQESGDPFGGEAGAIVQLGGATESTGSAVTEEPLWQPELDLAPGQSEPQPTGFDGTTTAASEANSDAGGLRLFPENAAAPRLRPVPQNGESAVDDDEARAHVAAEMIAQAQFETGSDESPLVLAAADDASPVRNRTRGTAGGATPSATSDAADASPPAGLFGEDPFPTVDPSPAPNTDAADPFTAVPTESPAPATSQPPPRERGPAGFPSLGDAGDDPFGSTATPEDPFFPEADALGSEPTPVTSDESANLPPAAPPRSRAVPTATAVEGTSDDPFAATAQPGTISVADNPLFAPAPAADGPSNDSPTPELRADAFAAETSTAEAPRPAPAARTRERVIPPAPAPEEPLPGTNPGTTGGTAIPNAPFTAENPFPDVLPLEGTGSSPRVEPLPTFPSTLDEPTFAPQGTNPDELLIRPRSSIPAAANSSSIPPFPGNGTEPAATNPAPTSSVPNADRFQGTGIVDSAIPSGLQQPELQIEKDAPPRAVLNEAMVYNIRVRNVGRSEAHQVIVEDKIPKGTVLRGTIPEATLDPRDKHLIWQLGTLRPGEERLIRVQVVPTEPGEIGSVATVRFVGRVAARTVITAPKLELQMQGPTEVAVGEQPVYRFRITNSGDGEATGVVLINQIPALLQHPAGNDLEYDVGTLQPGQSRDIELPVTAATAGQAANTALVVLGGQEQDRVSADVVVLASRLAIERTGPERRFVGRPATYSTQISNQSSQPLSNVTVVERLPPGTELAAVPEHGQYDPQQRTITWLIRQLGPHETSELKTSLVSADAGEYASQVQAWDAAGNRANVQTQLQVAGFASLKVDVSQLTRGGGAVAVGEQVSLRMVVKNRGSTAASDVVTEFEIPPELEFVAARPEASYTLTGNKVRFNAIPTLPIGGEQVIDIVCTARQPGQPTIAASIWSQELNPVREEESVVVFREEP